MAVKSAETRLSHGFGILRRQTLGPVVFGLLVGGVPVTIALSRLGGSLVSPAFLHVILNLTPLAVIITALGASLPPGRGWKDLGRKALVCSSYVCVPLPWSASLAMMWRFGYDVFSWENSLILALALFGWALVTAAFGWLIALVFSLLLHRKQSSI